MVRIHDGKINFNGDVKLCCNLLSWPSRGIWSNKMRSFLTMLGIIIGVASVIILVSLVNAYMSYTLTEALQASEQTRSA